MNGPDFYGVDYLKRPLAGTHGQGTRWDDNGCYYTTGVFIHTFLNRFQPEATVLDVGCGRGFVVRHLRNLGREAHGCEYGIEAVEHSVCGAQWGDLTGRLPYADGAFDFVKCVGVLSQFPAQHAENALRELRRVSRRWVWTSISIDDPHLGEDSWYHKNIASQAWWEAKLLKVGLFKFAEADSIMHEEFKFANEPQTFMRMSTKV